MQTMTYTSLSIPQITDLSWSQESELFYIADGQLEIKFNGTSFCLHSGDFLTLNPFEIYSINNIQGLCLKFSIDIRRFSADCSLSHIPALFLNTSNQIFSMEQNDAIQRTKSMAFELISFMECSGISNLASKKAEFNFLCELILNFSKPDTQKINSMGLLEKALRYIQDNYTAPITVHDIAQHCYISDVYLSHLFKDTFNITPSYFLRKTRLGHAKKLLSQSMSLTKIADLSGFKNARNLNASFIKEEGIYPSQYRKQYLSSVHNDNLRLSEWIQAQKKQKLPPKKLTDMVYLADAPLYQLSKNLFDFLEFGSASQLLKPDSRHMLFLWQKQFNFHFIRLSHIFDNMLLTYIIEKDHIVWDFSNLDIVLEFVVSIGLIPVITISSIPTILSPDAENTYYGFSNISMPSDFHAWRLLLQSFVTHLHNKFGSTQLKNWKVGFYFLPSSISLIVNEDYDFEEYYIAQITPIFKLYQEAFHIFRTYCPELAIGCPEGDIEDLLKSDHIMEWIFEYFKKNHCLPDYFPYHNCWDTADHIYNSNQTYISDRHVNIPDVTIQTTLLCDKIHALSPKNIPIYCTGWFCMPYSSIKETTFAGAVRTAHILRNSSHLSMIAIEITHCFITEDEKKDSKIWTSDVQLPDHLKRPFYYSLLALKKLPGSVLYNKDHRFVAANGRKIVIFLDNACSLSYRTVQSHCTLEKIPIRLADHNYYFQSNESMFNDLHNLNQLFTESSIKITLQLAGLAAGRYLMESTSISPLYGSIYDEWLREGAYEISGPDDYQRLNLRSLPSYTRNSITVIQDQYTLKCVLIPNEVQIITLTHQAPEYSRA